MQATPSAGVRTSKLVIPFDSRKAYFLTAMTSELRAWVDCANNMVGLKCQTQSPELSTGNKASSRHRRSQSDPYDGLHGDVFDLSSQAAVNLKLVSMNIDGNVKRTSCKLKYLLDQEVSMNIDGNVKQTSCNLKNLLDKEILQLHQRLEDQYSLRWVLEKALGYKSTYPVVSSGTPIPKPTAELIKEIAVLELQVMHLEQYLLSLYRATFDHHTVTSPFSDNVSATVSPSTFQAESFLQEAERQILQCTDFAFRPHQPSLFSDSGFENIELQRHNISPHNQISLSLCSAVSDKQNSSPSRVNSKSVSTCLSDPISLTKVTQTTGSALRSLADHLGASISDHIPETPDRLSENIVKCMAAIYCKLATPLPNIGLSASSPTSSLSTSTFSPQDRCDNWSPRCSNEATVNPCQPRDLKEISGPYSAMVEVPWICVDEDRLSYAARMLQNFKSLVQRLEKVDPGKMKHEEKLAFWINIHNALVMHAYLAYGIPQNNTKRATLFLKAAYNIGGHSINASVIQSSILGYRSYRPTLWLRTVFLPGTKLRSSIDSHVYALEHPEPLLHFALSSGGHSDPAVRVYTAKRIFQELEVAKEEYIRATVNIRKEVKIVLPKIMDYFAKHASLNLAELLEMIHGCVTESQQKAIERCLRGKPHKNVEWIPYDSSFRYIIQRGLAKA